jgi:hypothetical protein
MARPDDESGRFETSGARSNNIVLSIASIGTGANFVHRGQPGDSAGLGHVILSEAKNPAHRHRPLERRHEALATANTPNCAPVRQGRLASGMSF